MKKENICDKRRKKKTENEEEAETRGHIEVKPITTNENGDDEAK